MHYHCQNQHNNKYRYKEWTLWILCIEQKKKKKNSFSSVRLVKGKEKRPLHTYIPLVATAISLLLVRRASVRNRTQTHFLKNVIQENLATIYQYLAQKAQKFPVLKNPNFDFFFNFVSFCNNFLGTKHTQKKKKRKKKLKLKQLDREKIGPLGEVFFLKMFIVSTLQSSVREREREWNARGKAKKMISANAVGDATVGRLFSEEGSVLFFSTCIIQR